MNSNKIILDLCGGTGSWSRPFKDNGYTVIVITLPTHSVLHWKNLKDGRMVFPKCTSDSEDIYIEMNKVHGILAAPPCTMFSIARNDKTALTPRDLRGGMKIVNACLEIIQEFLYEPFLVSKNNLKFWALENPESGYLKRFIGCPPYVFDPSEFGDNHSKKTAVWGMFNFPKKGKKVTVAKGDANNYVKSVERYFSEKAHLIPEGYKAKTGLSMRTIVRSITPQGFAKAFFEANK